MVLLAASSLLLFFTTYALGKSTVNVIGKWLRLQLQTDFLGIFFIGLITSYSYFNLISFLAPVNYMVLLPLLLHGIYYWAKKKNRQALIVGFRNVTTLLFNQQNASLTFGFLAVLFLFWLIPPGNWDSGDYHYLSIQWYEDYAVVPGLANIHGRLAFNPANFIISAAYSFTSLVGQPLYPLNGVIEILFFTWLLRTAYQQPSILTKTILIGYAIMRARDTLINITSPSSDMLLMTLLSYCAIQFYFLLEKRENILAFTWPLLLLTAFGPCTKLSAVTTLLLIPLLWFGSGGHKSAILFFKSAFILVLLWVPWLVRNAIMSGYVLYPIQHTNIIPFDWTIPREVLLLDDFYTRYSSRGFHDQAVLAIMNLPQLVQVWFKESLRQSLYPLSLTLAAFLLPPIALIFSKRKRQLPPQMELLFGVYYISLLIWLIYSPEYRFGITLIELLILFSLLQVSKSFTGHFRWLSLLQAMLVLFMVAHFALDVVRRPSNAHWQLAQHWFYPARDYRYQVDDHYRQTFPYKTLQNGTRLYYADTLHRCLNAPCLPCMMWPYGEIELRGRTIQQGFRNTKNEVRKNYPWLPGGQ